MKYHLLLGKTEPDAAAVLLGTGYWRFESPYGIDGLFKEEDDNRLNLLMVIANDPGKGHFRTFMRAMMANYKTICVWSIWNQALEAALIRYGFTPETEILSTGEAVEGLRWDKNFSPTHNPKERNQNASETSSAKTGQGM
jgi:hypothetical protein